RDCSSDVCSSDLSAVIFPNGSEGQVERVLRRASTDAFATGLLRLEFGPQHYHKQQHNDHINKKDNAMKNDYTRRRAGSHKTSLARSGSLVGTATVAALLTAGAANAQQSGEIEEIVVTGTMISR